MKHTTFLFLITSQLTFGQYSYNQLYDSCITHIASYEGFRSTPYKDQCNQFLIGYGHKIKEGEKFTEITKKEGIEILKKDFNRTIAIVQNMTNLTGASALAISLFVYNVGIGTFLKSSVYSAIKSGKSPVQNILLYNKYLKGNKLIVSESIQKRRKFEVWLYDARIAK